jgi:hypothetical protein
LTAEPDQLSPSTEDEANGTSTVEDLDVAAGNSSPHQTLDSMKSNDTFFTAVSQDISKGPSQVENKEVMELSDHDSVSTVSRRSTIKQSIHNHDPVRTPSPPNRSTSMPATSVNTNANMEDQTPAQAIAQLVRGRTFNSSPGSEHQVGRRKPPSIIDIPNSSQTVPRIEEHLASPTSIPLSSMNRSTKSVELGLLTERPTLEIRRRSVRRGNQSSRFPPISPLDNPTNSIASLSAITSANDVYIPISPHPCDARDDEEIHLKRDIVLCTKSVTAYNKEPMVYKASVASRYSRMKEYWREYELVLTNKKLDFMTNTVR